MSWGYINFGEERWRALHCGANAWKESDAR
jgi:hypothetical protein